MCFCKDKYFGTLADKHNIFFKIYLQIILNVNTVKRKTIRFSTIKYILKILSNFTYEKIYCILII